MALYSWNPQYAVGDPVIDAEHCRLFALADRLHSAMKSGSPGAVLADTLAALLEYTERHFRHEEQLMEESGYPEFAAHQAEHQSLTTQVRKYHRELTRNSAALSIETLHFLRDWLGRHIRERDALLAAHLRRVRSSQRGAA